MSRPLARAVARAVVSVLVLTAVAREAAAAPATRPGGAAVDLSSAVWSRQVEKKSHVGSLHVLDGVLLAGTEEGRVVGLDARTGRVLWKQRHPEPAGWDLMVAVSGGRVLAAMSDYGTLVAYEPRTGKVAWKRALDPIGRLQACPGHRLVAVTHSGRGPDGAIVRMVHALDPANGKTLWQAPVDGELVGSGEGWLIVVRAGDPGQRGRLAAVRCTDGTMRVLPPPRRVTEDLLHVAEGKVVSRHAESGGPTSDLVCVTELETGAEHCFEATDGKTPWVKVIDGRLQDGVVHVVLWRMYPDVGPTWWLYRYDLAKRQMVGSSEPETSMGELVGGAGMIVTGFGDHDGPHFGRVVEAATGQWLVSVGLRTLPSAVAMDEARGYFGTMGGEVVAVALPRPGPAPVAEVAVAPRAVAATAKGPDLGWRMVRTFDAHPRTARSAGTVEDGLAEAVAFLDEQRLIIGGNDDWVAVFDAAKGKQLWRSRKLGDDVEHVSVCERGFGVLTGRGEVTMFEAARSGRSFVAGKPLAHGPAWTFGLTPGCAIVVDASDETFKVYAGGVARVTIPTPGRFDRLRQTMLAPHLPVVGPYLVMPRLGRLEVLDLAAAATSGALGQPVAVYATPEQAHGGELNQAWMFEGRLVREFCSETRCVVELVDKERAAPRTLAFDTRGAGWDTVLPSMIAIARDASTLVFFRRGLDAIIVDTATDRRQSLADLAGLPRELVAVAFSPSGKRMAVAGYPLPWQVAILERP